MTKIILTPELPGGPELDEDDAPYLTQEMIDAARPAEEVLGPEVLANFKNKGGRPKLEQPKKAVNIRLSWGVLEHYKAGGAGWQTRLNEDLEQLVAKKRA